MKEISFEEIKKANESINTTNIKGKEYAEVNQRIKAFRMIYPNGTIQTDLISNENGVCVFKATVGYIQENGLFIVLGNGTAYEKEGSSFINNTSYIENCETSAVGRALGMAGFGIDTSVASYEEVANAIQQQEAKKTITKTMAEALDKSIENNNISDETVAEILEKYGYTNTKEIEMENYPKIVAELKPKKE